MYDKACGLWLRLAQGEGGLGYLNTFNTSPLV